MGNWIGLTKARIKYWSQRQNKETKTSEIQRPFVMQGVTSRSVIVPQADEVLACRHPTLRDYCDPMIAPS